MATTAAPPGPEDRLDSWKEIAAYLKHGVRTVQRWERTSGLPVHRLELDRPGSVFAYKQELDAWWASRRQIVARLDGPGVSGSARPVRSRWREWTAISVVFIIGGGISVARWNSSRRSVFAVLDPAPLTSDLGSEIEPTFSPDGGQVAYAWDGPAQNKWDIYVKMIGSDSPLQLTKGPEPNGLPSWSPDGQFIAFRRFLPQQRRSQILVIPPIGGPERIISEDPRMDGPLAWWPDSRWIVTSFSEEQRGSMGLVAIDVNTGELRRLTKPGKRTGETLTPLWRPTA